MFLARKSETLVSLKKKKKKKSAKANEKLPTPTFRISRTFREFLNLHSSASLPGL